MKNEFTIFFAIPFDSLTRRMYESLRAKLSKYYKRRGYNLITIIGNKLVGPSKMFLDIIAFKAQNEDLHEQFYNHIKRAHVVVADLTHDNPNVHLELGVALAMNKNILRVTGRKVTDLGFDIRNKETFEYQDADSLFILLCKYLDLFFKIKTLEFDPSYKELYFKFPRVILPGTQPEIRRGEIWSTTQPLRYFRDGGIKVCGRLFNPIGEHAWIGIILRLSELDRSGYLLRFCRNGDIELTLHPSQAVVEKKNSSGLNFEEVFDVCVNLQNDEMQINVNQQIILFENLGMQAIGGVYLASFECQAEFQNIEIINRDAI